MGTWIFEELRGAAVRRDPKEAELFKTEQAEEGEYAGTDALVREAIQNSIDAHDGDGQVRVRIAVHEAHDAPRKQQLKSYFSRLRRPLEARGLDFAGTGSPIQPCRFLVCEDFGTRGLEGDTELFGSASGGEASREHFFWFWRNIGISGKTGDDLGRWGLGKTVYRAASRASCMFGLTVRESDRRALLMGQTVLAIHWNDGKQYQPEGYWCGSRNSHDLPLPIEEESELIEFKQDWKLTRSNEPGLSVVAPFIPDEIQADKILQAVAVHFFARILRHELVVEIVGNKLGTVRLDSDSIAAVCDSIEWNGPKRTKRHVSPPIGFAERCLAATPQVETEVLGTQRAPDIREAFDDETLAQLRQQFAAGEFVSARVRVSLPRRTGAAQEGSVDVYVQRLDTLAPADSYYIREGMTITKLRSTAGRRGVQAIVNVDAGPMAKLLGDTEGPAHEDWQTSADRPNREWKTWKNRVGFVRHIVDELVDLLTPPATEPDKELLSDFFSIDEPTGQRAGKRPGTQQEEDGKMGEVIATPKWFYITERSGGFTVRRSKAVPLPERPTLLVSLAYDLPQGNPLKNWSEFDFQLSNGALEQEGYGVKYSLRAGNVVRLTVTKDDFFFSVNGFDPNRDLYVRVDDNSNDVEPAND